MHEPGNDDQWRDLYRQIAKRYVPAEAADAYVDDTVDQPRALIAVSMTAADSRRTTWRMPVADEDGTGIWHRAATTSTARTWRNWPTRVRVATAYVPDP